jgi:hypothetical protein
MRNVYRTSADKCERIWNMDAKAQFGKYCSNVQLMVLPTDSFLITTVSVQGWELLDQPSDQFQYTERLDLFLLLTTTVQ